MWTDRLMVGLALGAGLLACSSSSNDGKTVKDQAGRTCTIPAEGMTLTCDATPMPHKACAGGSTACFVQGIGDTASVAIIGPSAVCAACCAGNTSTSTSGDCS